MKRVGVFLCWCGSNISSAVDLDQVAEQTALLPHVVHVEQYKYLCSDPGQETVRKAIKEHALNRVVIAACSPRMHERTFRRAVGSVGLNPHLMEIANIREQCSWVHPDKVTSTPVAVDLVRTAVAKAVKDIPLEPSYVGIEKRALVVGGGIAGIQAALDIADSGYEVVLVEREPTIGGRMAQLDKTFPTLDCSSCILTPKMVEAGQDPRIRLLTYAEVESLSGYIGNFEARIRMKARSVDLDRCTGCGDCWNKCPYRSPGEFDLGLGKRKAIYLPFPQAVPNKPVLDRATCAYFQKDGKCQVCKKVCAPGAIDFEQQDEILEERFGAVVVATGFDLWDHGRYGEYGAGQHPDVISSLEFERLVSASGPTDGKIKRPSDGKLPERVVFIQCVGSRDEAKGVPYCSKVCCMYTAKHAILLKEKIPSSQSYVFYIDVRAAGKNYEEFYRRATVEYGAQYIRGRVSRIYPRGDSLVVVGEDTLLGQKVEVQADLVVLATAVVSRSDAPQVAQKLGFSYDQHGFFTEAHPKLAPVETNTAGIFLAGACQGPKDIPDTVAQAGAAAAKVVRLFAKDQLETEPTVARVDRARCAGCEWCRPICPYKAIEMEAVTERVGSGQVARRVAKVNPSLCHGCGACSVACRSGAMNLLGFSNEQVWAEVEALCL